MAPLVRKTTILVVEDDSDLRNFYRTGLTAAGYTVIAVEDGLDALRRIDLEPLPNAVVLDIGLPRLSGRDVQRELAANPATAQLPIIVISGTDTSDLTLRRFDCVLEAGQDEGADQGGGELLAQNTVGAPATHDGGCVTDRRVRSTALISREASTEFLNWCGLPAIGDLC